MKACELTISLELDLNGNVVQLMSSGMLIGCWDPEDGWDRDTLELARFVEPGPLTTIPMLTTLARQVWDDANGGQGA